MTVIVLTAQLTWLGQIVVVSELIEVLRVRALGLNVTNTEIVRDKRKIGQSSALEQNFKKCLLNLSTLLT